MQLRLSHKVGYSSGNFSHYLPWTGHPTISSASMLVVWRPTRLECNIIFSCYDRSIRGILGRLWVWGIRIFPWLVSIAMAKTLACYPHHSKRTGPYYTCSCTVGPPQWTRQHIAFRSDNMAVAELVRSGTSCDPLLMHV